MLKRCTALTAAALFTIGSGAACGGDSASADGKPDVIAAFYPLQFLAERVGGDAVTVQNLVKPGTEPHDLELKISQVAELGEADLVLYLKGFQPAVDKAVTGDNALDVSTVQPLAPAAAGGHEHEGEEGHEEEAGSELDPHVWLDPTRLATIAGKVGERLAAVDSAHAADHTARAATLRTDLEALDREFAAGLKTCARREIVTSHTAFGYLAARYDLEQIGITGLTPESEPTPQRLAEVAAEAREHGATTIFFETLVSPAVAETVARQVGAKTAVLDPIEGVAPGADYFSVMRANLATLRTALGCS